MTFGAAWTLKTELPPTRELNVHKIAEFRKIRKSKKKCPTNDPRGGTKIDFVTPFASELVVLRRQLAQICALVGPRRKKGAQQASRRPTNWSKTQQNTEKTTWKVPTRNPALKKSLRTLCEAGKTQENIIGERRAPRKHKRGLRKKHERGS